MHRRRKWQPTPVFLPGASQGWGSLVGCRLWGRTESDTTEATQQQKQQQTGVGSPWSLGVACLCSPGLFPAVLAPTCGRESNSSPGHGPACSAPGVPPVRTHQGTCTAVFPPPSWALSVSVSLSLALTASRPSVCLPADCKLSGAAFVLRPRTRAVPDTSQMLSTCANRPLELPAPGTRGQCSQSWQGPQGPRPVSPTFLTPCPVCHRGLSALPRGNSPLREGSSHFFSVIHCASSRHLPRSEWQVDTHTFSLKSSISCCSKVPQTWWLRPRFFRRPEVQNRGLGRAGLLEPGKPPASCSFRWPLAVLVPWLADASRRPLPCFTPCPFCVSLWPEFPLF